MSHIARKSNFIGNLNFGLFGFLLLLIGLIVINIVNVAAISSDTKIFPSGVDDDNDIDVSSFYVPLQVPLGQSGTLTTNSNNNYDNADDELDDIADDFHSQSRSKSRGRNRNSYPPIPPTSKRLLGRIGSKAASPPANSAFPRSDNRNAHFDDVLNILNTSPSKMNKCDRRIRVLNGATRIRDRGALVRFQCSYGYHMLGVSVAVCVRGQWSDPPPVCVKDGCKKLPIPLQGSLRQLYGGGVAVFNCNYGFELEGQRILTCDGQNWNGTAPVCREIPPITIAPPSTTFPSLPELYTTEESSSTDSESLLPMEPSSPTSSSTTEPDNPNANAPTLPRVDEDDDLVLVPSPPSPSGNPPIMMLDLSTIPPESDVTTNSEDNPSTTTVAENMPSAETFSTNTPSLFSPTANPNIVDVIPIPDSSLAPVTTATVSTIISSTNAELPSTSPPATEPEVTETTTPEQFDNSITQRPKVENVTTTRRYPARNPIYNRITKFTTPFPNKRGTNTTTRKSITWRWQRTTKPTKPTTTTAPTTTAEPSTTLLPLPAPADISPLPYIPNYPTLASRNYPENNNNKFELVPAAITPEKLDTSENNANNSSSTRSDFGHILLVLGTILTGIGASIIIGGILTYYWRKNKGIARVRSQDTDGRTLRMSEGSIEDLMWTENRDSGL